MPYRTLPLIVALLAAAASAQAPDVPAEFLAAWRQAAEQPAAARRTWDAWAAAHRGHDLGQVARLLAGIAALGAGDVAAALPYFTMTPPPAGEPGALQQQLVSAGHALAARAKMSLLAAQLHAYYRRHVEYPASLEELVSARLARPEDLIDPADPGGGRFAYEARARRTAPDVPRQTYTLRSESAGVEADDLAAAVQALYQPPADVAISTLEPARGQAFIRTPRPDGTLGGSVLWTVGQTRGELTLWAVYDNYVLAGSKGFPRVIVKEG